MKKILVVDDQPEVRQLVSLSLGKPEFVIRQAEDGESALAQARIEVPDLVILDLRMPGSPDGLGVCWELKWDPRFERTKVLILSGEAIKGSQLACAEVGADEFLSKPFSPNDLAMRVEQLLREQSGERSAGRSRILIVDDQAALRSLVSLTLGSDKFEIQEAANGQAALDLVNSFRPHVVVLDVMMPGELSGLDVCQAVKSDENLARTQVLMLTARGEPRDLKAAALLGADDYVVKPFSPLELIGRVDRLAAPEGRAPEGYAQ